MNTRFDIGLLLVYAFVVPLLLLLWVIVGYGIFSILKFGF